MNRKCVHYKVCDQLIYCPSCDACEMFEDLKTLIIRMIAEKCEQEIKYCDVVDEGRETINYKKIFENIIESR